MFFRAKKLTPIDTSSLTKLGQGVVNLSKYTEDEFGQVAKAFQQLDPEVIFYAPPPKPRRGTIAYADGTHWNPNNGEGPYWFDGTTYHPMGQNATAVVRTIKVQKFTAAGASTYTPSPGLLYAIIEGVGSGGGGGAVAGLTSISVSGGGGGAGGYSRLVASAATIGVSQTVTIGAAGVGGAAGSNNGTAGGDCSFGSLLIAKGGAGGLFASNLQLGVGGAGGVAGTGDITTTGAAGTYGGYNSSRSATAVISVPGTGGSSIFGGGATNTVVGSVVAVAGVNAGNYGSGGSGAFADSVTANAAGGNGSRGIIIVTEFCSQ